MIDPRPRALRSIRATAALLALVLGAAPVAGLEGGAPARSGDALERVAVGIGTLSQPDADYRLSRCTGVLVAPDLVLTAAHCVAGDPLGAIVVFYRGSQPVGPPVAARVAARYSPNVGALGSHEVEVSLASLSLDLAVLRLAAPVRGRTPLPLAADPARVPTTLQIAGSGLSGRRVGLLRTATLKPFAATSTGLTLARVIGARVCFGDSGGPVVARDRGGVYVWGVASAVITREAPCGSVLVIAPAAQIFAATGIAP